MVCFLSSAVTMWLNRKPSRLFLTVIIRVVLGGVVAAIVARSCAHRRSQTDGRSNARSLEYWFDSRIFAAAGRHLQQCQQEAEGKAKDRIETHAGSHGRD
jgi:hypothetical protein